MLGIGAIFLSYFYTLWIRPVDDNVAERIINAWKSQIIRPTKGFSRITVGYVDFPGQQSDNISFVYICQMAMPRGRFNMSCMMSLSAI